MAYRPDKAVIHGYIDNQERGIVRGEIWFAGMKQPMTLNLEGDCYRDLAGCRLDFHNPDPVEEEIAVNMCQTGRVGDITASRRVKILEVPIDRMHDYKPGEIPHHWGNALYLEWYSEFSGRVVIESADYELTISEHAWTLSQEEEHAVRQEATSAFSDWGQILNDRFLELKRANEDLPAQMNEFQWEQFMRERDANVDRAMEIFDKHSDSPDVEKIIEEQLDRFDAVDEQPQIYNPPMEIDWNFDDDKEPEPNPATEGIDWMRNDHGDIVHPLQHRSYELWKSVGDTIGTKPPKNPILQDMRNNIMTLSPKLAGALNHIWLREHMDPGFVIASVKRAMVYCTDALNAMAKLEERGETYEGMDAHRAELFAIREDMLQLMDRYRQE